jgi:hypothetical protein
MYLITGAGGGIGSTFFNMHWQHVLQHERVARPSAGHRRRRTDHRPAR